MGNIKIRMLRREAKLTQEKLAEMSGVKLTTIQKLESGVNDLMGAKVITAVALAKALGTTVEDLVEQ